MKLFLNEQEMPSIMYAGSNEASVWFYNDSAETVSEALLVVTSRRAHITES